VSGSEQRRGKRFSDALGRICSLARKEERLDVCDVDQIGTEIYSIFTVYKEKNNFCS